MAQDLPVLVEAASAFIAEMFSKDSLEGTLARWSLDVTNNTNDNHGRSLNDGDSLNNFLLVVL